MVWKIIDICGGFYGPRCERGGGGGYGGRREGGYGGNGDGGYGRRKGGGDCFGLGNLTPVFENVFDSGG